MKIVIEFGVISPKWNFYTAPLALNYLWKWEQKNSMCLMWWMTSRNWYFSGPVEQVYIWIHRGCNRMYKTYISSSQKKKIKWKKKVEARSNHYAWILLKQFLGKEKRVLFYGMTLVISTTLNIGSWVQDYLICRNFIHFFVGFCCRCWHIPPFLLWEWKWCFVVKEEEKSLVKIEGK